MAQCMPTAGSGAGARNDRSTLAMLRMPEPFDSRLAPRPACPSSNDLRPIGKLTHGVSGPSEVEVKLRFDDASSSNAIQLPSSHSFYHPEPPRRQQQAVPADGRVLTGRIDCTPDDAGVALRQAVREFRNPKCVTCSAQAAEHVAMLVVCLGSGKQNSLRLQTSRYPKLGSGRPH
jgi:hypothetical protein